MSAPSHQFPHPHTPPLQTCSFSWIKSFTCWPPIPSSPLSSSLLQPWQFLPTGTRSALPGYNSLEKTLVLGKIEGQREGHDRGWDGWMASLTHGHEVEQTPGDNEGQGSLACCDSWGRKSQTRLSDWASTTALSLGSFSLCKMIPGLKCGPSESWSMYFQSPGWGRTIGLNPLGKAHRLLLRVPVFTGICGTWRS